MAGRGAVLRKKASKLAVPGVAGAASSSRSVSPVSSRGGSGRASPLGSRSVSPQPGRASPLSAASAGGRKCTLSFTERRDVIYRTRFLDEELDPLISHFCASSSNRSLTGTLNPEGFQRVMRVLSVPSEIVHFMFRASDIDESRTIDFDEYMDTMSIVMKGSFEERLEYAFSLWDSDGNHVVDKDELRGMLQAVHLASGSGSESDVERIWNRLDVNQDGSIEYTEFARGVQRVPEMNKMFRRVFGDDSSFSL